LFVMATKSKKSKTKRITHRTNVTAKKKERFLQELVEAGGNVTEACELACLPRKTAYEHREKDLVFAEAWDQAAEKGIDKLEDEARRRAFSGVLEPVFHKGACVDFVRKYSDVLLIFLLKGHRSKYKEHAVIEDKREVQPINVTLINLVQEFKKAASHADESTRQSLIELLEGGNGRGRIEVGPSPVLLRKPLPSQSRKPTP